MPPRAGRPVLIDFQAAWCLPCREMERTTFRDPAVVRATRDFADVEGRRHRAGRARRGAHGSLGRARRADVRPARSRRSASGGASSASCRSTGCSTDCGRRPERRVADRLARALAHGGTVRALAAVTTDLVEEARGRHDTAPTATAALGRALTGALLLAGDHQARRAPVPRVQRRRPAARRAGRRHARRRRPRLRAPPARRTCRRARGKLDVGGALGRGVLCVMRVPIAGGHALPQHRAARVGRDRRRSGGLPARVRADAGRGRASACSSTSTVASWPPAGYLVQALPGATERGARRGRGAGRARRDAERAGARRPRARRTCCARSSATTCRVLEERDVRFRCRCSRERVAVADPGDGTRRDRVGAGGESGGPRSRASSVPNATSWRRASCGSCSKPRPGRREPSAELGDRHPASARLRIRLPVLHAVRARGQELLHGFA